jgi:hypothetical protein
VIDAYEQEAEDFTAELEEEYHRNGAGLKDTCDLAPIYDRYADLFSAERVSEMLARRHSRRERYLAQFAALQYLDRSVCAVTQRIATAETQAVLKWDGEDIPYRLGLALVPKEPDRARRLSLIRRVHSLTARTNEDRLARMAELHRQAEALGFNGYCQLCDELLGIGLGSLCSQMESLLQKSARRWQLELDHFMSAEGIPTDGAHIADLRYILTAPQFDSLFPRECLMPALERTLDGLGISLRSLGNLDLDTAERPLKSPRAFCSPVRVPSDVRLVIMPRGGREDYNTLFHEAGHALHFAHTRSSAPFAYRALGDNSVTEAYAFLLNLLLRSPTWLREVARMPPQEPYLRLAHFYQLYYLRRLAARLAYERKLHAATAPTAELADVYADDLGESLGVQMVPENYLADVDDGLYCTCYLRAWMLEVLLRRRLLEEFGERWFASAQAGEFLRQLWALGQEFNAEELAQRMGYPGLQIEPLIADVMAPDGS